MRVVDLCCGDGYFTAPRSRLVGDGAVIAVDLSAEMLARAREEVAREGRDSVWWILGDARHLADLIDERMDLVFLANTFHGVADKTAMCVGIRRALTAGGRLVVVNWHALPREQTPVLGRTRGPRTELRMSPAAMRAAVEPAGFRQVRVTDVGSYR
jgi:ubiquinone/menaquinone biosynthesis C-methylase UbiE